MITLVNFKVISGDINTIGDTMVVQYGDKEYTDVVKDAAEDGSSTHKPYIGFNPDTLTPNAEYPFCYGINIVSGTGKAELLSPPHTVSENDAVVCNGENKVVKVFNLSVFNLLYIGNLSLIDPDFENTGEDYCIMFNLLSAETEGAFDLTTSIFSSGKISCQVKEEKINYIDHKFIKDMYYTEVKDITLPVYNGSLTSTAESGLEMATFTPENIFELGEMVMLKIPSKKIDIVTPAKKYDDGGICYIGNIHLMGIGDDTGEDYFIYVTKNDEQNIGMVLMQTAFSNMEVEINVKRTNEVVYKLDKKYLPNGTATESYVDTAISNAITKTLNTEV